MEATGTGTPQNPKIILRALKSAQNDKDDSCRIFLPSKDNLLEIHFSIRGPVASIYEGGVYHGRILLDYRHPFKPPHIQLITKSGRFVPYTNICFSLTAFHPESWSPAVRFHDLAIGLQSLFDEPNEQAVGMIFRPDKEEVERCRVASATYYCPHCKISHEHLFDDQ